MMLLMVKEAGGTCVMAVVAVTDFMKNLSSFFLFLLFLFLNGPYLNGDNYNKNRNKQQQQQNTTTISNQKVNHPVLSGTVSVCSFTEFPRSKQAS